MKSTLTELVQCGQQRHRTVPMQVTKPQNNLKVMNWQQDNVLQKQKYQY